MFWIFTPENVPRVTSNEFFSQKTFSIFVFAFKSCRRQLNFEIIGKLIKIFVYSTQKHNLYPKQIKLKSSAFDSLQRLATRDDRSVELPSKNILGLSKMNIPSEKLYPKHFQPIAFYFQMTSFLKSGSNNF